MCSHSPAYTQCQILYCYTCGSVSAGATYPCRATLWHVVTEGTCEFRYSLQFIFAGPVYHNVLTNRAALLSPRGPSLCPSGNSPCAALCVDYTTCVAERYLTLRICGYMDAQSTSCGRKNPLPFPHSLSSEQPPCPLRKGVIHKRVETLVSTLLCACRVGKIPLASQATIPR